MAVIVTAFDVLPDNMAPPTNSAAEWSVLSKMMREPDQIGHVIGIPLEARDFSTPDTRLLYQQVIERHYDSKTVDPLVVAEMCREDLAACWSADPSSVGELLQRRVQGADPSGHINDHGEIVKRLSKSRQIMDVAFKAARECAQGVDSPEEIGDRASTDMLSITAGSIRRSELSDWMDVGRDFFRQLQKVMKAHERGIDIGVRTGLRFMDSATGGIAPGELLFLAGDPGSGKTSISFAVMEGFARRQMTRDPDKRMATLFLCLEMPKYQTAARWVQRIAGVEGSHLREGTITKAEYVAAITEWKNRENLPLISNFASNMKLSQMRSLVAEAIRKHNVGFVVIDHFRMIDTDRRFTNPNQEDENKVRFLKESLAQDLNVAVMCLAHTIKGSRDKDGKTGRPRLADLRGSGQIAAHADFVGFLYKPWKDVADDVLELMPMDKTRMAVYWEKNRFGLEDALYLQFNPILMTVRDD